MAEERCKHDLLIATCFDCSGKAKLAAAVENEFREEMLQLPGWFPARFPGRCPRCHHHFEEGTPLHSSLVDSERKWACC